jgi:3-oxoacyl-[acyl-carrier protein] reductase
LVTGGSRGIGRAICSALCQAGADVAVNYISNAQGAKQVVSDIAARGRRAVAVQADVANLSQVHSMVSSAVDALGGLDLLVNNVGITSRRSLMEISPQEWQHTLETNLTGAFYCSRTAAEQMLSQGSGCIINVTSASAIPGSGGGAHYASSKGGMNSLTRALARELAPRGIRVNAVAPAVVATDFLTSLYPEPDRWSTELTPSIPVGRTGTPEDVAYMVAFLASPLASYISGQIILVDGGRTFGS